jgi:hypothetical protein
MLFLGHLPKVIYIIHNKYQLYFKDFLRYF